MNAFPSSRPPPSELDELELELEELLELDEELLELEELLLEELLELEEEEEPGGHASPGHQFLPAFTVCVR